MYRGNLVNLTRGLLLQSRLKQSAGSIRLAAPINNFYSYSPEPSHPLFKTPTIVSIEDAVKCIKSGENIFFCLALGLTPLLFILNDSFRCISQPVICEFIKTNRCAKHSYIYLFTE